MPWPASAEDREAYGFPAPLACPARPRPGSLARRSCANRHVARSFGNQSTGAFWRPRPGTTIKKAGGVQAPSATFGSAGFGMFRLTKPAVRPAACKLIKPTAPGSPGAHRSSYCRPLLYERLPHPGKEKTIGGLRGMRPAATLSAFFMGAHLACRGAACLPGLQWLQ